MAVRIQPDGAWYIQVWMPYFQGAWRGRTQRKKSREFDTNVTTQTRGRSNTRGLTNTADEPRHHQGEATTRRNQHDQETKQ